MELACQMRSNSSISSDIEELNVTISQEGDDYYLDGRLPWVTNLRSDKFAALFAADFKDGSQPWIITIPSEAEGSVVLKIWNLFPFKVLTLPLLLSITLN